MVLSKVDGTAQQDLMQKLHFKQTGIERQGLIEFLHKESTASVTKLCSTFPQRPQKRSQDTRAYEPPMADNFESPKVLQQTANHGMAR